MLSRIVIAILAIVFVGCGAPDIETESGETDENRAPAIDMISTSGEHVTSTELTGNPVIVSFWATTCAPCRRELPMLQQLAVDNADRNLTVLTINTGEPDDLITEFFEEIDVDLQVLVDHDGRLAKDFELLYLPMTYFIDGDWNVLYSTIGEPNPKQIEHGLEVMFNPG